MGLFSVFPVAVKEKYDFTTNVCVLDGLTNGAECVVDVDVVAVKEKYDFTTNVCVLDGLTNGAECVVFNGVVKSISLISQVIDFFYIAAPKGENVVNVTFPYSWP